MLPQGETFGAGTVQRSNGRNAGNAADITGEHVRQANLRKETELEGDVFHSVAVIVNLHLVSHVGIEGEVVGAVGRFEERVNVEDHRYPVRMVIADERVPVGYVRGVVQSS